MEEANVCSLSVGVEEIPVRAVAQQKKAFCPSDADCFPDILIILGVHSRSVP